MPRKTVTSPVRLAATKKSPLGAVRIRRASPRSVVYCATLNPSGTFGHAFSGRGASLGLLPADCVAKGSGRSPSVILRILPGAAKRKSVKGAFGSGRASAPADGSAVVFELGLGLEAALAFAEAEGVA